MASKKRPPQRQYLAPGLPRTDNGDPGGFDEDEDGIALFQDFSSLTLRKHHETKPIWVCPNLRIYLEAFNPMYQFAYDFLIAICEPVARPTFVHEYKLTSYSLYAAVAVNIQTDHILDTLTRFSKNELPKEVVNFIRKSTETYGKAKLLLRENEYYIESESKAVATRLLREPAIKAARVQDEEMGDQDFIEGEAAQEMTANIEYLMVGREDEDDQDPSAIFGGAKKTAIFKIAKDQVRKVKEAALTMDPPYPLMEEYDFRKDSQNPALTVALKPTNKLRNYQEKSLNMFFGNGRARSGIIVLPCGAGKTLTGVTAAATIQKGVIVLANTNVSALQWKAQFKQWTTIADDGIIKFTSKDSQILPQKPVILITTYSMLSFTGRRNETVRRILEQIRSREWGLMILDEVHVAPANSFQAILDKVSAHSKLGLTATLVREDNLIDSLNSMIGPKLYEANWMDLTEKGHLANVQCVEAWCPMTSEFFQEYLRVGENYKDGKLSKKAREILYLMNPNKIRVCEYLMRYHEARGDKIIIFSDSVFALQEYARLFNRPAIYGGTKEKDRENVLAVFRISATTNTILLSRVGDTSIDLPEANVIIQVSSHFGSRRQEAQRLGRILRPKQTADEGFNAFFYTLVCNDTVEMRYSTKRQQYLVDQGYTYKVIPDLVKDAVENLPKDPNSCKLGKTQELELLARATNSITNAVDMDTNEESLIRAAEQDDDLQYGNDAASSAAAKRKSSSMAAISGGDGLQYMEYESGSKKKTKSR